MPRVGEPVEVHSGFRFTVKINGINQAAFTECTLPSLQVETLEVKEGGQNEFVHRLPVRVKPGTLKLHHGITRGLELLSWYQLVLQGKMTQATRQVTVIMYDATLKEVAQWHFHDAYPISWKGPTLKTDQSALAIEELELVYNRFSSGDE